MLQKCKKIVKKRKLCAKSTMEYLMSYGWALVIIVMVLSILAFLGIFSLTEPSTCLGLPSKFAYKEHILRSDGNFSMKFVNNSGKEVSIESIRFSSESFIPVTGSNNSNNEIMFWSTDAPNGAPGSLYRLEFDLVYSQAGISRKALNINCTGKYEPQLTAAGFVAEG
jgi:hypothetical protein